VKSPIPDTSRLELSLVGLVALLSLCWALVTGGGFQGWDDLHYVQAAQNWLYNGATLPTDHWSGRLPYVLLLTIGMMLFGNNSAALVVPNSLLFLIVIGTSWWIARLTFSPRSAVFAAILAATTRRSSGFPKHFIPKRLRQRSVGLKSRLSLSQSDARVQEEAL
jgi:hypothetical protein